MAENHSLRTPSSLTRPGSSILIDSRSESSLTAEIHALRTPSSLTRPGSSILIDYRSEGSLMAENHACGRTGKELTSRRRRKVISIDMLPDEVLLAVFDFCADEYQFAKYRKEEWQSLVHVCRRWRSVVFGSPRRLKLQLVCTARTPVSDTLDVWPALPLFILCDNDEYRTPSIDNMIAALKRNDRICNITLLGVPSPHLESILPAMQEPFPELTDLKLRLYNETLTVLPDSFLGGSAPLLRVLSLSGILFPGLPNLLLSATHLVCLYLECIPHSWYFSPEAMVTALSTLTSLEDLWLEFQSPLSRPDRASRRPPPSTRSVLPVLAELRFKGDVEYLDDLVARIDAPQLDDLNITFFNVFDTPQVMQFISRTPTLEALEIANVVFSRDAAWVSFSSDYGELKVKVPCRESDWQVSYLEQICTSSLPPLSRFEVLYIYEVSDMQQHWQEGIETVEIALWLGLLHPFTGVKELYLSKKVGPFIALALQELVGARTTEALPTLQNIFLEDLRLVQERIGEFIAARQVISHPIAVSGWHRGSSTKW
jgi:hypothetical protein